MHISNERYFDDRRRHDLALRMIRHEARTQTIRACTGLTDDRIRRLYKTYASHVPSAPLRRHRGKSPQRVTFFVRNTRTHFESSLLASVFAAFGLVQRRMPAGQPSIEFGCLFCDAFETYRQLLRGADISFEHAWFLLQLLRHDAKLVAVRCRHCDGQYLRDRLSALRRSCPACKLKAARPAREAGPCARQPRRVAR